MSKCSQMLNIFFQVFSRHSYQIKHTWRPDKKRGHENTYSEALVLQRHWRQAHQKIIENLDRIKRFIYYQWKAFRQILTDSSEIFCFPSSMSFFWVRKSQHTHKKSLNVKKKCFQKLLRMLGTQKHKGDCKNVLAVYTLKKKNFKEIDFKETLIL